jgi:hypothetical protein
MEKGILEYQSPPGDEKKSYAIIAIGIGFIISIIISYFIIIDIDIFKTPQDTGACIVYNIFIFTIPGWILIYINKYSTGSFTMYENGISRRTNYISLIKEGPFIPYDEIKSYTITKDKKIIRIFLKDGHTNAYGDKRIKPILKIEEKLIEKCVPKNK